MKNIESHKPSHSRSFFLAYSPSELIFLSTGTKQLLFNCFPEDSITKLQEATTISSHGLTATHWCL